MSNGIVFSATPRLGDIARGCDVGVAKSSHKAIWCACLDCKMERWVLLRNGQPQSIRCFQCSRNYPGRIQKTMKGSDHWHWKGGRGITALGYVELWLDPSSPFFPMAHKDGYIFEHRLVMAQHLNRCLSSREEVHHRDGVKNNNILSNLEILSKGEHYAKHHADTMVLLRRIAVLELELATRENG